jgi:tRNA pseudouridine55 synthase
VTGPQAPFGFLNAFKPPGISSTSFGVWIRRRLGARALGHWGTLDPPACGVLVLAVGSATRLIPYLPSDDKAYVFELRAGSATDTGDATGRVVRTCELGPRWAERLDETAASLVGTIEQVPPMYSAVKVQGRPLYKAARAGRDVDRAARTVTIRSLRAIGVRGDRARLHVECSAGTYVRTLCEQIGERLGVVAHMSFLLRTRSGPFGLAAARTVKELELDAASCLLDPLDVVPLPRIHLDDAGATRFAHGDRATVTADVEPDRSSGPAFALHRGALIGVGIVDGAFIAPVRVLAASGENE